MHAQVSAVRPKIQSVLSWAAGPMLMASGAGSANAAAVTGKVQYEAPSHAKVPWVRNKIDAVRKLALDWDHQGAEPIDPAVVRQMEISLEDLLPAGARAGSIVPGADGSLQAEWHLNAFSIGFLIESDLSVSCWTIAAGSQDEVERLGSHARDMLRSIATVSLV